MKIEAKEQTISGVRYAVTPLFATEGRIVFVQLARSIGPAIKSLRFTNDEGEADDKQAGASLAEALGSVITSLDEKLFAELCDRFAKGCYVHHPDGRMQELSSIFDVHFAGNYGRMVRWFAFCLQVNFGNFFEGLQVDQILDLLAKFQKA